MRVWQFEEIGRPEDGNDLEPEPHGAPHMLFAGAGESTDAFFWMGAIHLALGSRLTTGRF